MSQYYVKIFQRWEHGASWGYLVSTNNIEALRKSLAEEYNRFTITEV